MISVARSARGGRPRGEIIPIGTPFGRLTVTSEPFRLPSPAPAVYFYRCRCECGQACDVRRVNLVSGNTTSCGCRQHTTHGESGTRLHGIRSLLIQRCYNPKNTNYPNYGGRGVLVCPEWRGSYEAFRDWSLANGYADHLEIDRIDNDSDYCPDNCRWVTRVVQSRNKRSNRFYTAFGETKCITDWAADPRCKVSAMGIRLRLKRHWDFERALTEPRTPKGDRWRGLAG